MVERKANDVIIFFKYTNLICHPLVGDCLVRVPTHFSCNIQHYLRERSERAKRSFHSPEETYPLSEQRCQLRLNWAFLFSFPSRSLPLSETKGSRTGLVIGGRTRRRIMRYRYLRAHVTAHSAYQFINFHHKHLKAVSLFNKSRCNLVTVIVQRSVKLLL